ncbi:hypothetical protein AB0K00_51935 [Dactylosporangium sp. NPDC049525]|uniref:hypothetical protein n=1 Tax=Dactylosporangium sp. NPDC049525 TaxID=3154730 RepID=UPI0034399359
MSAYLISIASAPDAAGAAESDEVVSILVEAGADAARIVEMTVRSSAPGGLFLRRLPQIDLAVLGRALVCAAGAGPEATTAAAAGTDTDTGAAPPGESRAETSLRKTVSSRPAAAPRASRGSKQTRRTERAYRRMPDVDELLATFAEIGSVTKLAEHYGVPRHTAQGWMGRARKARS